MGTKILLAGGETTQMMEVLRQCKTRFILVSYYYMRQKWKGTDQDLLDYFKQFEFVLLDSGAFTMFNKPGITYNDMERYAYEYAEFIERMKTGISAAVELDLYEIPTVGLKSHDIRRNVLEKSGVPIVPVYHGDLMAINKQTKADWEEFCKTYQYVGIASRMWEKGPAQLAGLNTIARKHKAVTHGFGITRQDFIRNSMFFTVDSSVSGDTVVVVRYGGTVFLEPIEQLYEKVGDRELSGFETLTLNGTKREWMPLQACIKHTVQKPMATVVLEGGRMITLTADHSMIQMNRDGEYVEVAPAELSIGDYVLQADGIEGEERDIEDDLLVFMGLWVGDGWFIPDSNGIGMSCANDPECLELMERVAKNYGCRVCVKENGVDCHLYSAKLKTVLSSLGCVTGSENKTVPYSILSASTRQRALFLKGYYSADGYCGEAFTVSPMLYQGLCYLLGSMGFTPSVTHRSKRKFKLRGKTYNASSGVTVGVHSTEELKVFRGMIGYLQAYKYADLDAHIIKRSKGDSRGSYKTGVPTAYALTKLVRAGKGWNCVRKQLKNRANREGNEGRFHPNVLALEALFLRVKAVKIWVPEAPIDVYDLAVPGSQKFLGNGVVVHNTAWTNGQRFGTHYVFEGTKLRIYSNLYKDRCRKRHMKRWEREGFDLTGLLQDKTEPFVMLNCHEWTRFQEFVFNQSNRDYWEPELEVNKIREGKPVVAKKKAIAVAEEGEVAEDDIPYEEDFPVIEENEIEVGSEEVGVEVLSPEGMLPVVSDKDGITTMEGLFEVEEGEDYVYRDKFQKKTWKARFNRTDFGVEELHLDAGTGEWVMAHKVYRDPAQKGVSKGDLLYQNHLVHCFSRGLMSVKKVADMKAAEGALVVRTESLPMAEAITNQVLKCEDCYLTDRCHAFSPGQTCKYSVPSSVENVVDLARHLQRMMGIQFDRVYKGAMIEKMDGGVMDKTVSDEIMRTFNMAKELRDIFSPPKEEIVIKATGKQSSGGVLQALFGTGDKKNGEG